MMMQHAAVGFDLSRRGGKKEGGKGPIKEKQPDDRVRTTRQPHRRALPADLRADERAESPLGRLALRGIINEEQYDAGCVFAGTVGSYAATIEQPRAISGTLGHLAVSDYPDDAETVDSEFAPGCAADQSGNAKFCHDNPDQCDCLARRQRYMRAYEALTEAVGRRGVMVINRVAVHHDEIAREDIVYLKRGLTALARYFGLIAR